MKRQPIIFIVFIALLVTTFAPIQAFANEQKAIKVFVDDEQLKFEVEPVIKNGITLVPVRAILEKLGMKLIWNGMTQTILISKNELSIKMIIDNTVATINGEPVVLQLPPTIIKERTFVPLRFIGEATDSQVLWDGLNRIIEINTKDSILVSEDEEKPTATPTQPSNPTSHVDKESPIVSSTNAIITPATVSVGKDVTVEFNATDDIGIKHMSVWLLASNGVTVSPNSASLVSGTEQNGRWKATVKIPSGYPAGTWSLQGQAIDGVNHVTDRVTLGSFEVGTSIVDIENPIVSSTNAIITPATVSVGKNVTVEFNATDDIGIKHMSVWLLASNGVTVSPNSASLVSGTEQNGRWKATVKIPSGYPAGTWSLQGQAIDGVNHVTDRVTLGSFEVGTSIVDIENPIVSSTNAIITPATVSVGKNVTVEFNATDDIGIKHMSVWLLASNGVTVSPNSASLVSGTEQNGRWRATVKIPSGYPAGTWSLQGQAIDSVNHVTDRVTLGTFQVS